MDTYGDEKKYYSITEVSEKLEVNSSLLRYWEQVLPGINPKRNKKGNRFYTKKNIEYLQYIKFLVKEKGYTLGAVEKQLRSGKKDVAVQHQLTITLEKMRDFLVELRKDIHSGSDDVD